MTQHNNVFPIGRNISDEEKAYDVMVMHYQRIMLMDEMNVKALNRAGTVGRAVRDLLSAVNLYMRAKNMARNIARAEQLER